ncbi:hypothetical protein ColLi_09000 [Colletotrichum liriopes]|uniref:Uncharacterized protein n=1 Tax=Colletotrichum liriopes TaxID=708192 RepID=A0AA37GTD1_9PEZI|nr:hypothetical protein ColLi_09000 [Colletotrichum liriopes]
MGKAIERLRTYSASLDGNSTCIYMNYANPEQDVIGSYGAKNAKFLKETAAKYDPTGFFQTGCLVNGSQMSFITFINLDDLQTFKGCIHAPKVRMEFLAPVASIPSSCNQIHHLLPSPG